MVSGSNNTDLTCAHWCAVCVLKMELDLSVVADLRFDTFPACEVSSVLSLSVVCGRRAGTVDVRQCFKL